jgi:hypothetical protein
MIKGRFLSSQFVDANFYQRLMLASILHVFVCITLGVECSMSISVNKYLMSSSVHVFLLTVPTTDTIGVETLTRDMHICLFVP